MMLETQHRDQAKRKTVAFRVPARGKLGSQLADFLAMCEEKEDRPGMPVCEFWLSSLLSFPVPSLGFHSSFFLILLLSI